MAEVLSAREIVSRMCDDIEVMNYAAERYMDAVKTRIGCITKTYENQLLTIISRIDSAADALDDKKMISQYPEEDRPGLVNYIKQVRTMTAANKKSIYRTMDLHWLASH